jgi:hypothetical protein
MHKSLLSLGVAAAVPLLVAAAAASPASAHDGAARPAGRWVTPANDKEAHVPIWFTLSIGGAEAAGFFKEATGFDSE